MLGGGDSGKNGLDRAIAGIALAETGKLKMARLPYPGMAMRLETVGVGGDTSPHYCIWAKVIFWPRRGGDGEARRDG